MRPRKFGMQRPVVVILKAKAKSEK